MRFLRNKFLEKSHVGAIFRSRKQQCNSRNKLRSYKIKKLYLRFTNFKLSRLRLRNDGNALAALSALKGFNDFIRD